MTKFYLPFFINFERYTLMQLCSRLVVHGKEITVLHILSF